MQLRGGDCRQERRNDTEWGEHRIEGERLQGREWVEPRQGRHLIRET